MIRFCKKNWKEGLIFTLVLLISIGIVFNSNRLSKQRMEKWESQRSQWMTEDPVLNQKIKKEFRKINWKDPIQNAWESQEQFLKQMGKEK